MIKKSFMTSSRKIITFEIENKVVRYLDEVWKDGMQILPKDRHIMLKLMGSRDANLKVMAALIMDSSKGKNLEEYNSCKDDKELAEFITRECLSKGLLEVK